MRTTRGRTSGQTIISGQGRAVRRVAAAVEAGPGGGAAQGRVDHQEVTRGAGENQLGGVTSCREKYILYELRVNSHGELRGAK